MGEGDRDSGGRGLRQRHIKLIAEGDTFPLSESEYNPSTQPAAVRCAPFFKNCGGAATTTLSPKGCRPLLHNPPPQAAITSSPAGAGHLPLNRGAQ